MRRWGFLAVLAVVAISAPLIVAAYVIRFHPVALVNQEAFFRYVATNLSENQKKELYTFLAQRMSNSVFEAVPEPLVGRILQSNIRKTSNEAEIVTNSAGMRSSRPFVAKESGRFRILCLGDSMVMGTAGKEEDRWGDQIEEILRSLGAKADGREIEVYSIGVGSWSALNEATYLSHRISSYEPDAVLVMMVDNDLSDTGGVMGIGQVTYGFTPEHRRFGSGVLVDHWPFQFGFLEKNLLGSGMGMESRTRWQKAFSAWKRLEVLLDKRSGRMVFAVLQSNELFLELCKFYYSQSGMKSPFIITGYFGERLPHDPHPNRAGNRILAVHSLHVLSKMGVIGVRPADLPPLHPKLSADAEYPCDTGKIQELQKRAADAELSEEITFDRLTRQNVRAMLGGIYPGSETDRLAAYPYGTPRSAFMLKRKTGARSVVLELEVPPRPELYPFRLQMILDGKPAAEVAVDTEKMAGRLSVRGTLPERADRSDPAVEVMLLTDSYWSDINDYTMKSYRLISVRQE